MEKKQLIMEKALELFAKQGFAATSVQQITEHCGISKGAFYLSFKSKDELTLAIIDSLMAEIIADFDHLVRNTKDEQLLYQFYYVNYYFLDKHSDAAKIFIKEQSHTVNENVIIKLRYYDKLLEEIILKIIERLYGELVTYTKYDLTCCIKNFMTLYAELFLYDHMDVNLDLLSQSLVEKTDILAKQTTIPVITSAMFSSRKPSKEITKDDLFIIMDEKIAELEDSITKESLMLLKEDLRNPNFSPAIIKGLIENIRSQPHCKWIAYLLQNYYHL